MKKLNKLTTSLAAVALLAGASALTYAVDAAAPQADGENLMAGAIIGQALGSTGSGNWSAVNHAGDAITWPDNATFRNSIAGTNGGEVVMLLSRWDDNVFDKYFTYRLDNLEEGVYEFKATIGDWGNNERNHVTQVDFIGVRVAMTSNPGYNALTDVQIMKCEIAYQESVGNGETRYNNSKTDFTGYFNVENAGTRYISFVGNRAMYPISNLSLVKVADKVAPTVSASVTNNTVTFTPPEGAKVYAAFVAEGESTASYSEVTDNTLETNDNGTVYYYAEANGVKTDSKSIAIDNFEYVNCTTKVNVSGWSNNENPSDGATHNFRVTPLGSTSEAKLVERYWRSATTAAETALSQKVTGLEAGTYKVQLYATANRANGVGTWSGDPNNMAAVFANDATVNMLAVDNSSLTSDEPYLYTIYTTVGDNGELTIGSKILDGGIGHVNWFCIQIKSLQQVVDKGAALSAIKALFDKNVAEHADLAGKYPDAAAEKLAVFNPTMPENATVEDYQAAIDAMNDAAMRAVIESNALAEAIEGRTDCSEQILNSDFNDGTNNWTSLEGELGHKGANQENPTLADGSKPGYFDLYSNKVFRVGQTLSDLPAGKYRISMLARGSEVNWFRLRVMSNLAEDGSNSTPFVDLPHNGNTGQMFDRGWNMAYLDFEFAGGELLFSVNGNLGNGQWAGFTHVRLVRTGDLEADPNQLVYEQALVNAKAALASNDYVNITGNERDELTALTEAETPADSEAYKAATEALNNAIATFTAAKAGYDSFATAKARNIDALSSASDEKKAAFNSAVATEPTTAAEATAAAADIAHAYKVVVESNSVAEGIEDATDYTDRIVNPKAENGTEGWTLAQGDGNGNIGPNDESKPEKPVLSDNTEFRYFDGGNWGGNDWTTRFEQTTTLPVGKYRLAVLARGATQLEWFRMHANNESINLARNGGGDETNGTFGRGWEDHALDFDMNIGESNELLISIQARGNTEHQWHSFTNFRLTKIGELESTTVNIPQSGANASEVTFAVVCLPYSGTLGNAYSVYRITGIDATGTVMIEATDQVMEAGVPYLVVNFTGATDAVVTFTGAPVEEAGAHNFEGHSLQGTFVAENLTAPAAPEQPAAARRRAADNTGYTLYTLDADGKNFVKVAADKTVPANSAYLRVSNDVAAALPESLPIQQNVATGINGINSDIDFNTDAIYDLQGRRVVNPAPGIYVRNGKKILIRK